MNNSNHGKSGGGVIHFKKLNIQPWTICKKSDRVELCTIHFFQWFNREQLVRSCPVILHNWLLSHLVENDVHGLIDLVLSQRFIIAVIAVTWVLCLRREPSSESMVSPESLKLSARRCTESMSSVASTQWIVVYPTRICSTWSVRICKKTHENRWLWKLQLLIFLTVKKYGHLQPIKL